MTEISELRVLFVHFQEEYSFGSWYPPLWPAYLAASAETKLGPDRIRFRLAANGIRAELESFKPDIVAIGAVTKDFNKAIWCANVAKQYGVSTIVGGVHISFLPDCLSEDMDV